MADLSVERRNEIAFMFLTEHVKKQGISTLDKNGFQRDIIKGGKDIGLGKAQTLDFARQLYLPLINDIFYDEEFYGKDAAPVVPVIMGKEQRNKIALKLFIVILKKRGLPHLKSNEFRREILNKAQNFGIEQWEILEFARQIYTPIFNDLFSVKSTDDGHNFRDGVESGPCD